MKMGSLLELCLTEDTANLQERFHIIARHEDGKLLA